MSIAPPGSCGRQSSMAIRRGVGYHGTAVERDRMPITIAEGLPPAALWPERIYTLPETRYPVRLNVARELLDRNAEGDGGARPAIFFQDQVLTYDELARRVGRLANGLRDLGLEPGDRVLLRLPNCPEFVVTWLACQKLGLVPVSTMPLLRARELAHIIQDAGTETAIVWGGLRAELERAKAPELKRTVVAGAAAGADLAWSALMDGQPTRCPTADT